MGSSEKKLEQRVTQLEKELRQVKAQLGARRQVPWYRQILGEFKDDPVFDEIVRMGRQIREADRKRAR